MHSSSSEKRAATWIAALGVGVAVCWLFAVNLRSQRCAVVDDAFISFRFARHLVEGHGLTWNASEPPVEGASNLSLVLVLGLFHRVSDGALSMLRVSEVLGVLGALGAALAIG